MSNKNNDRVQLYSSFRKELDEICIPLIFQEEKIEVTDIIYKNKNVGIFCVYPRYIDCIYVLPEYRGKGLASKTVKEWAKNKNVIGTQLHIINNNEVAKQFWGSLFELEEIIGSSVDTLYEITGVKFKK